MENIETLGSVPTQSSTGGTETGSKIKDCKVVQFCKDFFTVTKLKALAAIVGASTIVVGSLAAKGIIVFASAAGSLLAAKILIPVGCVILVVLLAKMAFDCASKALNSSLFSN